jgi:stage II sporulation protein D
MRTSRGVLIAAAIAAACSVPFAAGSSGSSRSSTAGPSASTFVLNGRGYGHGVGLSQCGALGYAKHGWNYRQILAHYYPGTTLTTGPATHVRILVADGRRSVKVASKVAFKVKDAGGVSYPLKAGTYTVGIGLKLPIGDGGKQEALAGPVTFVPGKSPLQLVNPYHGSIVISVRNAKLRAVNLVSLDQYIYSVVPREIGRVGAEALKAQAVAARSFALATHKSQDFDLYADTRSQVYGGLKSEYPESNAAVDATARQVLTYKGKVITAFYSASSGGRTAAVQDVWGGTPQPYLVSVPDPYDDYCSSHSWGPLVYGGSQLAAKLRMPGRLLDARTLINSSKRVSQLVVTTTAARKSITGDSVRSLLALRSTFFRVGVLSLAPPARPAVYDAGLDLTGVARGLGTVILEQRSRNGKWSRVVIVRPAPDGTFSVTVRPKAATYYRLTAGKAKSGPVRVQLAPQVTLALQAPDLATGRVRPALPGAAVSIQRLTGGRWRDVARTQITAGEFAATLDLAPGSYRARVAAGRGLASGLSPPVRIVP